MTDQVIATYWVETTGSLEQAAENMAGEQSTGTFVRVERETDEVRRRCAAQVVDITEHAPSGHTPLPGARPGPQTRAAAIRLAFPLDNFGPSIPNLQAAVAGNLFEMRDFAAIKLLDLDLPAPFGERYPGPAFGLAGTRAAMGRPSGVMIGTIIKPSIGLTPTELAEVVAELVEAGIDFIKDDELQGNGGHSPLQDRIDAVMPVLHAYADRSGRMPMYAFNITDDLETMRRNHDAVLAAGGNCVMACINLVGLAGVEWLRRHSQLPIHGHRTMFGAVSRSPQVGIAFRAYQKLARLSGVDHLHTNGLHNKFYESDEEVLAAIADVRAPLLGTLPTVPVLSSGQWAGVAHETYAAVGTTDLLTLAGGGIHGHPDGAAGGVESMREAWDAAVGGEPLSERAARVPSLRHAIDRFG